MNTHRHSEGGKNDNRGVHVCVFNTYGDVCAGLYSFAPRMVKLARTSTIVEPSTAGKATTGKIVATFPATLGT